MSTAVLEISENAPSVCLGRLPENPNRLMSLWDILNKFVVAKFLISSHCLSASEAQLEQLTKDGKGAFLLERELYASIITNVASAYDLCKASGFLDAAFKISSSLNRLQKDPMNVSALGTELRNIREVIMLESSKQWFLKISRDLSPLVDQKTPFGKDVADAFPSAQQDLTEACNCLAVECGTACVFHLMRAAEVALRALASDRGVSYPDASINSKQVGDLLGALDGKMADMRKADAKNWPSRNIKDAQIAFYHRAIVEFRDFNEAWRKHMAHGHEGAFYNPESASGIMKHVRTLMEVLATKISEVSQTQLYWTAM